MERADRWERRERRIAKTTTGHGQQQRVLDVRIGRMLRKLQVIAPAEPERMVSRLQTNIRHFTEPHVARPSLLPGPQIQ
ncbi:MAG TPA: hypothetical protein VKN18_25940 [Blastocatellia bacterium]|nr:hypothetical protein [Blastocatellia bacterium]